MTTEKKHPTFSKRVGIILFLALFASGLILADIMGFLGPQVISGDAGIWLGGMIIVAAVSYVFWAERNVSCPECGVKCEPFSDKLNRCRKVRCPLCLVVWNLGVGVAFIY